MTLKQRRLMKNITQQEMADALGVAVTVYARWEHNPESIKLKNADRICAILGECREIVFPAGGLSGVASKPGGVRVAQNGARTSENGTRNSLVRNLPPNSKNVASRTNKHQIAKTPKEVK